jgi:hypothetical protein
MNRITLGILKRSLNNRLANYCNDDPRLTDLVNRACQRLLEELKSVGTFIRYRVCVNQSCITWPRQIETIEAVAICRRPGTVRNGWFEFLEGGPGVMSETACGTNSCSGRAGLTLLDAGESVQFDDLVGTDKKLAISVDVDEEDDATILIQYYDSNGQWVRTQPDTAWIDGEEITLPATGAFAYTSLNVMAPGAIRVIKPVTNGVVRLWEYDVNTTNLRALAVYEPSEEIPVYRRSTIPNLPMIPCCDRTDECAKISVEVVAKIRFIPVTDDNDFLPISHLEAVRLACQAIHKEESDLLDDAAKYWVMAVRCLTKQLEHWIGHGAVQPMRMVGMSTFGGHVRGLR